jgi:hypothetical protein
MLIRSSLAIPHRPIPSAGRYLTATGLEEINFVDERVDSKQGYSYVV